MGFTGFSFTLLSGVPDGPRTPLITGFWIQHGTNGNATHVFLQLPAEVFRLDSTSTCNAGVQICVEKIRRVGFVWFFGGS